MRGLVIVIVGMFSQAALAAPTTWTLKDVLLDNGTYITGSFDFDPDVPRGWYDDYVGDVYPYYSNIDITFMTQNGAPPSSFGSTSDQPYLYSDEAVTVSWASYTLYHGGDNSYFGGPSGFDRLVALCYDCTPATSDSAEGVGSVTEDSFVVHLDFLGPLTSGATEIEVTGYTQIDVRAEFFGEHMRYGNSIVGGSVVSSVVPVPAAVWLFASGLLALGGLRRGQTPVSGSA